MVQGQEKRKHPRVDFVAPLEIISLKDRTPYAHGITRNISVTGLGVESNDSLFINKTYIFSFSVPTGQVFRILGEVKWMYTESRRTLYGIRFNRLGFFVQWNLSRFVRQALQTQS